MKLHVYINNVNPSISGESLENFRLVYIEGQFLFDSDIAKHLDYVHSQAVKLQADKDYLLNAKDISTEDARKVMDEIQEITTWFHDDFKQEKARFEKHLCFK